MLVTMERQSRNFVQWPTNDKYMRNEKIPRKKARENPKKFARKKARETGPFPGSMGNQRGKVVWRDRFRVILSKNKFRVPVGQVIDANQQW